MKTKNKVDTTVCDAFLANLFYDIQDEIDDLNSCCMDGMDFEDRKFTKFIVHDVFKFKMYVEMLQVIVFQKKVPADSIFAKDSADPILAKNILKELQKSPLWKSNKIVPAKYRNFLTKFLSSK